MNNISTLNKLLFQTKHFYVFFVTIVFSLLTQIGFAQVSTYGYNETISTYTALSTSNTCYTAPWDDHVSGSAFLAPIGFTFNYEGVNQTQCYISPNGFISFGVQPTSTNYLPLSIVTPFTGGGSISALGMDLISGTATDNIVYNTIGTAPNRIFVVQWTNARRKIISGNFNFQIRLKETSNNIEISYGSCSPTDTTAYNAQVGIRGVTNDFVQGDINNRLQSGSNTNFQWFGKTVNGIASSSTVRTSLVEYPNNGLRYTYTPPMTCTVPTGVPSLLLVGTTSVTSTSFVGNTFTAAIPSPTNYLILRSTVNTSPTNAEIPNRVYWNVNDVIAATYTVISNTNTNSFNQTGLTPNTKYYYWVIPYNSGCLGGPFYNISTMISTSKTTCIAAPLGVVASSIGGNSFTTSWNTVTGATDYFLDVSTTSDFSAILPTYNAVSTAGLTSMTILGLNSLTTYYFRVRADGLSCNVNSTTASATTLCGFYTIPYFQNFDTTPVATIPNCFTITNNNLDGVSWQVQNSLASSTPNAIHLSTNTLLDSNDWFFTPGLNLTAGVSYRLKFKYNTQTAGFFAENLRVRLGIGPSEMDMNITLIPTLSNLVNTVYQTEVVDFTPILNGVYYLGFQGYSFANQSKIMIDDISVIISPTCFEPDNLIVTSVGISNATISWEASFVEPLNGYQYYISTSNVQPSISATPSGSVGTGIVTATISGLSPATLYYVWVRGNCSLTDQSVWSLLQSFSTDCSLPTLLPVTNGTLCGGGSTTLTATSTSGSTIEWFDTDGTTLLATGNNFVTPTLFATKTYFAKSRVPGGLVNVGPVSPISQGGTINTSLNQTYVLFSVSDIANLKSLDIYPITSGQNGVLSIRNSSNVVLATYPYVTNVAGGNTPQTIPIGLDLTVGSYFLYTDTVPSDGLRINTDNTAYPYASSLATISDNGFNSLFYMYAYNWKFANICQSSPTPVTATVTTAPSLTVSQNTAVICSGETTSLITVAGSASYNTFVWSPNTNISGSVAAGFTFNPTTNNTYTLTATQTAGSLCNTSVAIAVTVKPEPPAISIIPSSVTLCEGQTQILNGSLVSAPLVTIYEENFNAATNGWIKTRASTGGLVANSAWTLRNSIYPYTSPYWTINMSSNDASQFYFSNSDAQGGPTTNRTLTYLESPNINLTGYTSATLSFWHYLKYVGGNKAQIEYSINSGASWLPVNPNVPFNVSYYQVNQGTASGFVNSIINISNLIGNPSVKIRFVYDASWDWGWAIDNVKITGNLALEVSWSPPTSLYFDSAALVPYISGTPTASVYAKPNSSITYTGTAIGTNGCSTSNTAVVTVIPAPITGVLSSSQTICASGNPNNLTVTASTGTKIRWEYATDAAFTIGLTPIANTTNTLTTAAIGTFIGTRYYRVVYQTGTCPFVYSNSVFISFSNTTWTGTWSNGVPTSSVKAIFNADYSSTGDLNTCSVEVLSGNVVFNTGHTLTVENEVKVTGGSLTFDNNASLVQVNTLNSNNAVIFNTGNITYKRATTPMFKFDYTYWSTPVSPQILGNVSPLAPPTLFYHYNAGTNSWQYVPPSTTTMIAGKGYISRAPTSFPVGIPSAPQVQIASFIGVPNTGTITTPTFGGASQFNLLGNPYPSALSANAFLLDAANAATLSGTIYLWTHNTPISATYQYTDSDYAIYNYLGGIGTAAATNIGLNNAIPNGKISSGQGFFIKGLANGSATFKNSMRLVGNNDQFFRMATPTATVSSEPEKHRYWLNISNNQGAFKQLLVGYADGATLSLDRLFDGEMVDAGNVIGLYTLAENTKLSIQGRPIPFDTSDVIPLGYKSTIASSYNITMPDYDGLFISQKVYLEDKDLNIIHDLKSNPYIFATAIGTFDSRFVLRYTNETLGTENPVFNENSVVIYKNTASDFVITTGAYTMSSVKVYDIRGRLLLHKKAINASQTTFDSGDTNQVLLVQITTIDGIKVTKKVVR